MKVKKLWALLICVMTAFLLFSFSASAEGDCGHKEEFREWKTTANSCTTEGKYELICNFIMEDETVCGHVYETEIIPAHNYTVVYISKAATCIETGIEVVYCSWCNNVTDRVVAVNPANHKFSVWTVTEPATCIAEGAQERHCTREGCGYVETASVPVAADKHVAADESAWKVVEEATCYVEGLEENTCKVCKNTFTRPLAIHYDYATNKDDYSLVEETAANCTRPYYAKYHCRDCGVSFTVEGARDASNHDYTDESKWEYTEGASCKHPGKLIKYCKYNRSHTVEEDYAPHIFEGFEVVTAEPGCKWENEQTVFTPGEKEIKCIYCDVTETKEIQAGEHSFGDWIHTDGSTCAAGGTATRTCTCGKQTESIDFKAGTHLNYSGYMMAPNCISTGYEHVSCKQCATQFYVFPEGLASKGAHTPGKWVTTKEATCAESGERELYCDICDTVYQKEVIPQREHSKIVLKEGLEATCTQSGNTDFSYCPYCNSSFEQDVIPSTGHKFVEQFTPGEGAVRICEKCFEYEIINDGGNAVTCSCLCHNSNGLAKTVWKIITFFLKLFGINQECKCGIVHY